MTTDEMSKMIAEFERKCQHHDLTWMWSDSGYNRRKGQQQLEEIKRLAHGIPRETAIAIWNSIVDKKMKPEARKDYYWKEDW